MSACVSILLTLSDVNSLCEGKIIRVEHLNYRANANGGEQMFTIRAKTVWHRTTEFGTTYHHIGNF